MGDGAMRLVMSPEEARSWIAYLIRTGGTLPEWVHSWDHVSSVWLEEVTK